MLEQLKEILAKVLPEVDMATVTEDTRLIEDLGFGEIFPSSGLRWEKGIAL